VRRIADRIAETWQAAPVTLKVYAVITTVVSPVEAVAFGTGNLLTLAFLPVSLVINYFLLRGGVPWLWWLIVASSPFYILAVITDHPPWFQVVTFCVTLGLLLLPESRRHVLGRGDEAPVAQSPVVNGKTDGAEAPHRS
jgi:hypothetical protein